MRVSFKIIILKFILLINFFSFSYSYADSHNIYEIIENKASRFPVEQIAKVDVAILKLAVYEILFQKNKEPAEVVINEAIEIAKKKKQERVRETLDSVRKPAKTTYSSGLYNPKYVTPTWRSLDAKKKTKQFNYY